MIIGPDLMIIRPWGASIFWRDDYIFEFDDYFARFDDYPGEVDDYTALGCCDFWA